MLDLDLAHAFLRYSHIVGGSLCLVSFWVPVFAKKGSRLHIRAGKLFVACGYYVAASALVSCAWGLAVPDSFLTSLGVRSEELATIRPQVYFLFAILGFLATAILAGLRLGVRVIQTKSSPDELATPAMKCLQVAPGIAGLALLVFGLSQMPTHGVFSRYLICVLLGAMGVHETRNTLRFLANPRPTPMAWWYQHMECMLGCGIGFHTAFLVFGFSRLIALPGPLALIPWLLPSAVGVPAITIWVRHYRRKFGELDEKPTADQSG